jgi:hypothetical protein
MIENLDVFRLPKSIQKIALTNLRQSGKEITPAMSRLLGDVEEGATNS